MPRYAKKRDISEGPIVATLRMIGCKVIVGTDCDLYVRCPKGHSYLIECKTPGPDEKRRQKIQKELAAVFGDQYKIAKTPNEALTAIGYYECLSAHTEGRK